ncbi:MAG: hypothetical protein K2K37_13235 [Muribaculaceae bacterium]|nr:hypothetical protein [Muribaculaceae bacterium]
MNRLSIFLSLLFAFVGSKADEYAESFNIISDNYTDNIQDAQIIRNINGGTVIIPDFDETCPEEIKAPFSYACKIVEEYLPPCMPLRVAVSCGTLRGSYENAISKVLAKTEENFGMSPDFDNVQMSVIKGVILAELAHSSTVSYFDSVPDVKFLTEKPDIIVTYNDQRLDELSFSLDPEPGENYDFVSIAVRDLLIGLGLSSSYRKDPLTGGLLDPSQKKTPFECVINQALGYYGNSAARMNQATRGEIVLKDFSKSLKLHAPSTWRNGISLNYFVPQEDCCVSNILSYNFCRGMVTRSLSDQYADFIFRFLLGWRPNYSVSTDNEMSITTGGSTSLLMPYNGSISFKGTKEGIHSVVNRSDEPMLIKNSGTENEALKDYINSFDPFRGYEDFDAYSDGTSVSVLKKDGT